MCLGKTRGVTDEKKSVVHRRTGSSSLRNVRGRRREDGGVGALVAVSVAGASSSSASAVVQFGAADTAGQAGPLGLLFRIFRGSAPDPVARWSKTRQLVIQINLTRFCSDFTRSGVITFKCASHFVRVPNLRRKLQFSEPAESIDRNFHSF